TLLADAVAHCFSALPITAVMDDDLVAGAGQCLGDGGANAVTRPGDEGGSRSWRWVGAIRHDGCVRPCGRTIGRFGGVLQCRRGPVYRGLLTDSDRSVVLLLRQNRA